MSPRRTRGGGGGDRPRLPWDDVHPTLDLHGETGDSARERAERWLRERRTEGVRVVRLVTGRGLHSVGPPVLPGEIAALLGQLKGKVVASWEPEPGGGVYRVELRRPEARRTEMRRPPPDPRPTDAKSSAPPGGDAELRRRAEESLAELGIKPTPALIQAEMRRLLGGGD